MSASSRYLAFFSYLLSLPGALYVLFARRDDAFATFHARQSLVQALVGIVLPILWIVLGWLLAWVPLVGPMISVCLFGLVLAVYAVLVVDWIIGMVYALQGRMRRTPVAGPWALRTPPAAPVAARDSVEAITDVTDMVDRTTTIPDA